MIEILWTIVLILGGIFSPNATLENALDCPNDITGEWTLEYCAIEFSDAIPIVGETIQQALIQRNVQHRNDILEWLDSACLRRWHIPQNDACIYAKV